ncbi:hypothetical protein [Saccharothrix sp. Mg75]|uniref:hypothetical protein n=1 Tax=Saccharothrix sp. Mg75 TaxID=3445357 RepID=UPI003EECF60A
MQFARAVRAPLGVAAVVAACLLTAAPAGAHTPAVKAGCIDGRAVLTVGLGGYDGRRANTVEVVDNDRSIEDSEFREAFRRSFSRTGRTPHAFRVTVRAWDDPRWSRGWSFTREHRVPVCAPPPPPPAGTGAAVAPEPPPAPAPAPPPPTPASTTVETTTTTTTTPVFTWPTTRPEAVVVPASAESGPPVTRADVVLPLALGALLLLGGPAVLIVLRRRLRNRPQGIRRRSI